jgi:hypothetical protein
VQLHRAPQLQPARDLAAAVRRAVAEERELCLSPGLFAPVADGRRVLLELKRGRAANEMTLFRYDVTILPAGGPEPAARVAWTDFEGLAERAAGGGSLLVTGIPNRRLVRPLALAELLEEAEQELTVWDLERRLWERCDEEAAVDPEDVAELAARLGRRVRLLAPEDGLMATFDAWFEEEGDGRD